MITSDSLCPAAPGICTRNAAPFSFHRAALAGRPLFSGVLHHDGVRYMPYIQGCKWHGISDETQWSGTVIPDTTQHHASINYNRPEGLMACWPQTLCDTASVTLADNYKEYNNNNNNASGPPPNPATP
jgi:hypothetical protein